MNRKLNYPQITQITQINKHGKQEKLKELTHPNLTPESYMCNLRNLWMTSFAVCDARIYNFSFVNELKKDPDAR